MPVYGSDNVELNRRHKRQLIHKHANLILNSVIYCLLMTQTHYKKMTVTIIVTRINYYITSSLTYVMYALALGP